MPTIKDKPNNAEVNRISRNRIKEDVSSPNIKNSRIQDDSCGLSRLLYRKVYSCTWTSKDNNCGEGTAIS